MKCLFFIVFAFVVTGCGMSQNLSLIKATQQNTNGGAAGMHGSNYYILIKSERGKEVPDSIYVDGEAFKLMKNKNLKIDSLKHTFAISVGVSHNDYRLFHPMPGDKNKTNKPDSVAKPVRKYNGAALLIYRYKGKKRLLVIKQMELLPPLNYP